MMRSARLSRLRLVSVRIFGTRSAFVAQLPAVEFWASASIRASAQVLSHFPADRVGGRATFGQLGTRPALNESVDKLLAHHLSV